MDGPAADQGTDALIRRSEGRMESGVEAALSDFD